MSSKSGPTATSQWNRVSKGGRDGRRWRGKGTYVTVSRGGVTFPNEDVGNTITREQYLREERD